MSADRDTFLDWLLTVVLAVGVIAFGLVVGGIVAVWIEVL